jgi:hypothetical protein
MQQMFKQRQSLFCEILLSNCLDGSEFEHGLAASFGGGHSSSDVVLRLHRYVRLDLLTKSRIAATARREVPDSRNKPL